MSEWKKVKLGEICERITSGGTPKANVSSYYYPPIIPWLKTKEVNYCRITETENFISEEGLNNSSAKLIAPNSVIVAMYGQGDTAGRVAINKIPLTTNQACCNLTIDESKADYEFIYYQLCTLYNKMVSLKAGAAQPNLNAQIIKNLEVKLPSLLIQHHIATILSRYDSLIENYQKQIKLLEEAAQRLYKEWFVDLQFPGHENTKIIEGVPEGWEMKTIDDVTCKVTTGLNPRKNFVLGKGSNYYVTIKNMADNSIFLDDRCDRVDNEALEKINKRSDLKIGDILFSGIGTIGRVALIDIPTNNWNVSESVFTMRANEIITKEYLYFVLLSSDMQNYCQSNAHGAAQKGIRMADLKAYCFDLPPYGIVQKFTSLVTPTIKKVSSIRNQIRLLTEARDRLLPKLMNSIIKT
ncbi:MAG: restriction endonuclease subunit S [Bacteroidaceae bacterium]|nr:restriction endonuclease subunit S [Bacteroidaceae bacterium]